MKQVEVYLEVGRSKVFAGAVEWPGWCRAGKDEAGALAALLDYGGRYGRAIGSARLGFKTPKEASDFKVVERLKGTATTDFGAPDVPPKADAQPVGEADLKRLTKILKACWRALDAAAEAAEGKELRKGPRGGGRDLDRILEHVLGSEGGYLGALGWKFKLDEKAAVREELKRVREEILKGVAASAAGEIPKKGPRGGERWGARYLVRREAWHVLDHAWEVEERVDIL